MKKPTLLHQIFTNYKEESIYVAAYVIATSTAIVCLMSFILFTDECRRMSIYTFLALVLSTVVMLLFFLLLENIIPLTAGVLLLVCIIVAIIICFSVMEIFYSGSRKEIGRIYEEGGKHIIEFDKRE